MRRVCFFAVATVLAAAIGLTAQDRQTFGGVAPEGTTAGPLSPACTYPFGGGNFSWCISAHGNLVSLVSPVGAQHFGAQGEGYSVCHSGGSYYDLATFEAGWGAPILLSLSGSKVAIRRTTIDNRFTLDQTWTRDNTERDLKVLNLLTSNVPNAGVVFIRSGDTNVDGDGLDDAHDFSDSSAWVRDVRAVTLTDLSFGGAFVWVGNFSAATCSIAGIAPRPQAGGTGDKYFMARYVVGNMNAGNKKKFTLTYRVQ